VDEVRRAEVFCANERDDSVTAKAIKRTRWALLKSSWNLNAIESEKLDGLQGANRGIFRGYLLRRASLPCSTFDSRGGRGSGCASGSAGRAARSSSRS
jgi:hypothetical protein